MVSNLRFQSLVISNGKSAIARFSRTLGTLVTSGVPILQALNITRDTAGNVVVAEAIDKVHDAVKEGESIVTPMTGIRNFPQPRGVDGRRGGGDWAIARNALEDCRCL
jgi:type II secretory pathway component PulF